MNGLLKTSPTKVRLVSLKKSWKQAGRSHKRRDFDFAESAAFAAFDLRNRTQLNGHSNTSKRGFPLACAMPNFNDVRLGEMQKKKLTKAEKNRHHIVPRGQGVKGAKLQCQPRERCGAKISQREHKNGRGRHTKVWVFDFGSWCAPLQASFHVIGSSTRDPLADLAEVDAAGVRVEHTPSVMPSYNDPKRLRRWLSILRGRGKLGRSSSWSRS